MKLPKTSLSTRSTILSRASVTLQAARPLSIVRNTKHRSDCYQICSLFQPLLRCGSILRAEVIAIRFAVYFNLPAHTAMSRQTTIFYLYQLTIMSMCPAQIRAHCVLIWENQEIHPAFSVSSSLSLFLCLYFSVSISL